MATMEASDSDFDVDMLMEEEMLLSLTASAVLIRQKRRAKGAKRKFWTRNWLLDRPFYGQYEKLLAELKTDDVPSFMNFLRVDPLMFQEVVDRVGPTIEREDTNMRKALSPGLRIAITLRFLATGDSYKSLQYGFRVAHNTISLIIPETCQAIIQEYQDEVLCGPRSPEEWKHVANTFSKTWNFHNTLGAIDGKHIAIRCPRNGGSVYFNYKGFHSIVLLAVVDGNYKFLYVDVGTNGSCSDAGIFLDTPLRQAIEQGTAGIPDGQPLPNDDQIIPYSFVGDDAFPL